MLRTTRRAATFLVGVGFALAGMPKEAEAFLFRGAAASNVSSTLIKTLTVQNTSVSATPTNSITPSTLLHFNEGDIPSGTWPILKTAGGTTVPYSYWNKATWADGSLSCLCVLPRFPDSVTGNGTAQLQVWSGGTQPTASNRTLSEVYAANFQMVGNGGIDNISGNTFQLSATPNGSAITVQSNGDLITSPPGGQLCYPQFAITTIPANPPATQYISDTASANSQSGYGANQFGCVNWALALGITTAGLSACSTELAGRQSAVNYPANPKYAMQTSY